MFVSCKSNMPIEETLLDPPVTPAPIFAYRALKGWFIGSPDSSPERDNNKENIMPLSSRLKSIDEVPGQRTPIISPYKRKRYSDPQVSPTKSILRTPGAPTPRAKSLRDVNVKFKSVSPDIRMKSAPVAAKVAPQSTVAGPNKVIAKTVGEAAPTQTTQPEAKIQAQQIAAIPSAISESELDELVRRTGKEMKRLIKYGHKWRELARRQDEENAKLRVLLETAERETRRLEAALRKTGNGTVGSAKEQPMLSRQVGTVSSRHSATTTGKQATNVLPKPVTTSTLNAQDQALSDLLDLTPPPAHPSQHATSTAANRSTSAPNPTTVSHSTTHPRTSISNPIQHLLPQLKTPIPTHSPLTALQHRIEGSVLPISDTAARTRMPVDRVAAVRKRLMAKDQARRAGMNVLDVEIGEKESGVARGAVKRDIENSEVDWVGV